jgi:hypothetical protein
MPFLMWALLWTAPAISDDASPAASDAASAERATVPEARTPEQKQRSRNTVVLLAILTGIALTGLLLVIIAVAARGLSRKMAVKEVGEPPSPRKQPKPPEPPPDEAPTPAAAPQHDQPPPNAN